MTEAKWPRGLGSVSRRRLWLSLIGAGLALVISSLILLFWISNKTEEIQRASQERSARLVATGLANAVYGDLITRDYGALESRLVQAMSTENLLSALLLDGSGKVLAHVQRDPDTQQPLALFDAGSAAMPADWSQVRFIDGIAESWVEIGAPIRVGRLRVQMKSSAYDAALLSLQSQVTWVLTGMGTGLMLILGLMLRQTHQQFEARESGLLQIQRQLTSVAYRDSLTGLPNRHMLREQLVRMIAGSDKQGSGFAICFLDLDEFKSVNDRYGHDAGDDLLVQVARRLENCLRQSDVAFRLGGDEFVLLLSGIHHIDQARPILERIMETANRPCRWKEQDLHYGISMGVALYPSDAQTPETLISFADHAMYAAKRSGKSQWQLTAGQEDFFA